MKSINQNKLTNSAKNRKCNKDKKKIGLASDVWSQYLLENKIIDIDSLKYNASKQSLFCEKNYNISTRKEFNNVFNESKTQGEEYNRETMQYNREILSNRNSKIDKFKNNNNMNNNSRKGNYIDSYVTRGKRHNSVSNISSSYSARNINMSKTRSVSKVASVTSSEPMSQMNNYSLPISVWTCTVTNDQFGNNGSLNHGNGSMLSNNYPSRNDQNNKMGNYSSSLKCLQDSKFSKNKNRGAFFSNNQRYSTQPRVARTGQSRNFSFTQKNSNQQINSSFAKNSLLNFEKSCPSIPLKKSKFDSSEYYLGSTKTDQKYSVYSFVTPKDDYLKALNSSGCRNLKPYDTSVLKKSYLQDPLASPVKSKSRKPLSNCFLPRCDLSKLKEKKPKKPKITKVKTSSRIDNCGYAVFSKKPFCSKGSPVFSKTETNENKTKKDKACPKIESKKDFQFKVQKDLDRLCHFYKMKRKMLSTMVENLGDCDNDNNFSNLTNNSFTKQKSVYTKEDFLHNDDIEIPTFNSNYSNTNQSEKRGGNVFGAEEGSYNKRDNINDIIKFAKLSAKRRNIKKNFEPNETKTFSIDDLLKSTPDLFGCKTNCLAKDLIKPDNMFNPGPKKNSEGRKSEEALYMRSKNQKKNDLMFSENNMIVANYCEDYTGMRDVHQQNKNNLFRESFPMDNIANSFSKKSEYPCNIVAKKSFYKSVPELNKFKKYALASNGSENTTNNHNAVNNVVCSTSHYYIYKMINNSGKKENDNNINKNKRIYKISEEKSKAIEDRSNRKKNTSNDKKTGQIRKSMYDSSLNKMKQNEKNKTIKKGIVIKENNSKDIKPKNLKIYDKLAVQSKPRVCDIVSTVPKNKKSKYIIPNLKNFVSKIHLLKREQLEDTACLSLVNAKSGRDKWRNKLGYNNKYRKK